MAKPMDRRTFVAMGAASLGAAAFVPSLLRGAAPAPFQDAVFDEMTPEARKSIEKGIDWILKAQNKGQGFWGCEPGAQPSAAITGLAGLVLLATGSTPGSGKHMEEINHAVDWALRTQAGSGFISTGQDWTGVGAFFEHSSITMFLTEAFGMSADLPEHDRLRAAIEQAIHYLDGEQNPDGGYGATGKGSASDLAITASVYSALRSAHNSGLDVTAANMDKVIAFTEKHAISGGGFRGNHGMFYPTAAGLRIMYSQSRQGEAQVQKSAEKVLKHVIASEYGGSISEWDYLAAFYATHAFMLATESDAAWKEWFPKIRDYLIKKQNPDGSWTVEYCMQCRAFATALSLLILMAPQRSLPMWQL